MKRLINIAIILCASFVSQAQVYYMLTSETQDICDVTHTISGDDIECPGDGTIITANPTGGGGTYQYSWVGGSFQSSPTLNLNIAGTDFQSQVRDAADTDCVGPVVLFDVGYGFELRNNGNTVTQGDTIDVGSVTEGSTSTIEVILDVFNNTGSNILTSGASDFTFGNSDFALSGFTSWTDPPSSDEVRFSFNPTGLNDGVYYSTVVMDVTGIGCETDGEYNFVLKATVTEGNPALTVSGNSVTITDGDNTPSSADHTDYGDVIEGNIFDRTFRLTNTGTGNLNITNVALSQSGTPFSIQTDPTSSPIAEGGYFDFTIRFNSSQSLAVGTYNCTVQLTTNESGNTNYQWAITAEIVTPPAALMLDSIPGADAAYSLRLLTNNYTGDVINVRRSGDNANEGFTADEITDGTLASWVSAGGGTEDGFVEILYDQIGSDDFTMGNSYSYNGDAGTNGESGFDSYQPQIVDNGVVMLKDGKPAMLFDGSDDRLCGGYSVNGKTASTLISVFSVETNSASNNLGIYNHWDNDSPWTTNDDAQQFVYSSANKDIIYAIRATNSSNTSNYYEAARSGATAFTEFTTQLMLGFLEFSSNTHEMYMNNSTTPDGDNGSSLDGVKIRATTEQVATIGNHNAGDNLWPFDGYIFELIIYDENKKSDLGALQDLINSYYSIW
jgi:hypothetical protein